MDRMLFINLPVADLPVATTFYTGLGFTVNPMFSDENASCIVISDTILVMLLTRPRFADFVVGAVHTDPGATEVINCLSAASPEEVDSLYDAAIAHGGKPWRDKMVQGPMYGHSFADPDGHAWEVLHMDLSAQG